MINVDNIPGINYRHSAFSFEDGGALTLRFFNTYYCEQFIENHRDFPVKRLSPSSVQVPLRPHDYQVVQDYLQKHSFESTLDPERDLAARCFTGAINYANSVFVNSLMLGGAYTTNQEDKEAILEHLREISRILVKYESKGN